jgi:hypothetical protein
VTNLLPIFDLAIVAIADVGKPGLERIGLRPMQHVNLGDFVLALARETGPHTARPYANTSLWFGNVDVDPPAWIVVFTGSEPEGIISPREERDPSTNERVIFYYMRQPTTVFDTPGVLPLLFRFSAVLFGPVPTREVGPPQLGPQRRGT